LKEVVGVGKLAIDPDFFLRLQPSQQRMGDREFLFEHVPQIGYMIIRIKYIDQQIVVHYKISLKSQAVNQIVETKV
jgi:hypothetical protein